MSLGMALLLLGAAVLLGMYLGGQYLLRDGPPRGKWIGWVHGGVGALGIGAMLRAPHAASPRAAGFDTIALWLLLAALAGGLLILLFHRRRRMPPPVLIAMHGTIAIAGVVILAAYYEAAP